MTGVLRLPDPREKPWLTVAELAAITGEGQKAIRAALDAGQLPLLEVGRYKRIPTAALLRSLGIAADPDSAKPAASTAAGFYAIPTTDQGVQETPA